MLKVYSSEKGENKEINESRLDSFLVKSIKRALIIL